MNTKYVVIVVLAALVVAMAYPVLAHEDEEGSLLNCYLIASAQDVGMTAHEAGRHAFWELDGDALRYRIEVLSPEEAEKCDPEAYENLQWAMRYSSWEFATPPPLEHEHEEEVMFNCYLIVSAQDVGMTPREAGRYAFWELDGNVVRQWTEVLSPEEAEKCDPEAHESLQWVLEYTSWEFVEPTPTPIPTPTATPTPTPTATPDPLATMENKW